MVLIITIYLHFKIRFRFSNYLWGLIIGNTAHVREYAIITEAIVFIDIILMVVFIPIIVIIVIIIII